MGFRINLGAGSGTSKIVIASVLVLVGLGLAGIGTMTYHSQNEQMQNPVNVTGEVMGTSVDSHSSRRGGTDYTPEVRFQYTFEGQQYMSDNMYPGGQGAVSFSSESKAEAVTERYSNGTRIEVFVPPGSPGEGFMKAEKTMRPLFFVAIGLLMAGGGIYNLVR